MRIVGLAGMIALLLMRSSSAFAFPAILDDWSTYYPESTADDIGCQLCHANAELGGEPWNAYGWAIRDELQDMNTSNEEAFSLVEFDNSDADSLGIENFQEFIRNFQPGWREGNNNTHFFKDGGTLNNQAPPATPATTAIDFPAELSDPIPGGFAASPTALTLTEIAPFDSAVRAVKAPGIDGSLFVVEQGGHVYRTDLATGQKSLFLDASANLVGCNECGLLGLAFHPDFQNNGLFYTYQSETIDAEPADFSTFQNPNHQSKIVEYQVSDASCNSFPQRRETLLIIDQPQGNHNGGDLVFGENNLLYISLGDGGGASDYGPGHGNLGNGRNNENVLGTVLRIDPLGNNSANGKYGIPADNPFVGTPGVDEIYAYGFRNPFRMSFDTQTGELYLGDVGQNEVEEIDQVVKGGNYGWNWKEGSFFFYYYPNPSNMANTIRFVSDVAAPGAPMDLIDPVGEYDHDEGISITGGYVYRGAAVDAVLGADALFGKYIFADLVGGLFELNLDTGEIKEFALAGGLPGLVTGFGQDADQELYLVTGAGAGSLYKLTEAGDAPFTPQADGEEALCPAGEDFCLPIKASNGNIAQVCL